MSSISRVGDLVQTGGIIIDGASTVSCGGQLLALVGSHIAPHDCCSQSGNSSTVGTPCQLHCNSIITTGIPTVTCEGRQVAHITSFTTCSHPVITGDDSVSG
jgi:uncharacterized Zn-binding protein involved in type VI secretion